MTTHKVVFDTESSRTPSTLFNISSGAKLSVSVPGAVALNVLPGAPATPPDPFAEIEV